MTIVRKYSGRLSAVALVVAACASCGNTETLVAKVVAVDNKQICVTFDAARLTRKQVQSWGNPPLCTTAVAQSNAAQKFPNTPATVNVNDCVEIADFHPEFRIVRLVNCE